MSRVARRKTNTHHPKVKRRSRQPPVVPKVRDLKGLFQKRQKSKPLVSNSKSQKLTPKNSRTRKALPQSHQPSTSRSVNRSSSKDHPQHQSSRTQSKLPQQPTLKRRQTRSKPSDGLVDSSQPERINLQSRFKHKYCLHHAKLIDGLSQEKNRDIAHQSRRTNDSTHPKLLKNSNQPKSTNISGGSERVDSQKRLNLERINQTNPKRSGHSTLAERRHEENNTTPAIPQSQYGYNYRLSRRCKKGGQNPKDVKNDSNHEPCCSEQTPHEKITTHKQNSGYTDDSRPEEILAYQEPSGSGSSSSAHRNKSRKKHGSDSIRKGLNRSTRQRGVSRCTDDALKVETVEYQSCKDNEQGVSLLAHLHLITKDRLHLDIQNQSNHLDIPIEDKERESPTIDFSSPQDYIKQADLTDEEEDCIYFRSQSSKIIDTPCQQNNINQTSLSNNLDLSIQQEHFGMAVNGGSSEQTNTIDTTSGLLESLGSPNPPHSLHSPEDLSSSSNTHDVTTILEFIDNPNCTNVPDDLGKGRHRGRVDELRQSSQSMATTSYQMCRNLKLKKRSSTTMRRHLRSDQSTESNLLPGLPPKRTQQDRMIIPPSGVLLADVNLGMQACSLWCSENRRQYQLKNPCAGGELLTQLMRTSWGRVTLKEQLRFYKRVFRNNNIKTHRPLGKANIAVRKLKKKEFTPLDIKDPFYDLEGLQQDKALQEKLMSFQRILPSYHYDRLIQDFIAAFTKTISTVRKRKRNETVEERHRNLASVSHRLLYEQMKEYTKSIDTLKEHHRYLAYKEHMLQYENVLRGLIAGERLLFDEDITSLELSQVLEAINSWELQSHDLSDEKEHNIMQEYAVPNIIEELKMNSTTGSARLVIENQEIVVPCVSMSSILKDELLDELIPQVPMPMLDVDDIEKYVGGLEQQLNLNVDLPISDLMEWQTSLDDAWTATERCIQGTSKCCQLGSPSCVLSSLLVDDIMNSR